MCVWGEKRCGEEYGCCIDSSIITIFLIEGCILLWCSLLYEAVEDGYDPSVRPATMWVYCNRLLYNIHNYLSLIKLV